MTPAELRHIGHALHGEHWRSKLANQLTRDVRTIRRWGTGESPVPAAVARKLRAMAAKKGIAAFVE